MQPALQRFDGGGHLDRETELRLEALALVATLLHTQAAAYSGDSTYLFADAGVPYMGVISDMPSGPVAQGLHGNIEFTSCNAF